MAKNLTDANTYPAAITVPVDGDALSGASVETAYQGLANRTNFLGRRMPGSGLDTATAGMFLSLFAAAPLNLPDFGSGDAEWQPGSANIGGVGPWPGWIQSDAATGGADNAPILFWDLPYLPRTRCTGITLSLRGDVTGGGAHGAAGLPALMPTMTLYSLAAAPLVVASQVDTSANASAYDGIHTIALSGLTLDLGALSPLHRLALAGEARANALDNKLGVLYVTLGLEPIP
jgi:hypothetical protein